MPERHIFGSDDAGSLTTLLNAEFDKIWPGDAGAGGAFPAWYGTGRFVTDADDSLAPAMTDSPSLNIVLPDGFIWVQNGVAREVDGETLIGPLPAEFEGYISLSVDDEGIVTFTTSASRAALGSGVLAYFETDALGVTLIDVTSIRSDLVLSLPMMMARLNNYSDRLAALESGSGGSGGGATAAELLPWQLAGGDTRATTIVVPELIAAAIAAQGGVDIIRENPELRSVLAELGSQGLGVGEVNPDATTRSEATTVIITVTGDGSGGTIDDLVEGTANVDEEAQVIGP